MSAEDTEYYRERALVETHLASTAREETAAKLHAELATHYKFKVEESAESGDCDQPLAGVPKKTERPTLRLAWNGEKH